MVIMSIDLGAARTGVAVCDKGEILASPVGVIKSDYFPKIIEKIGEYCKIYRPELIVVGNPVNMDGSSGESSKKCTEFASILFEQVQIKTVLWDERKTTVIAHGMLNEVNVRGKKRKDTVDAVAATVILEDYLRYRKNKAIL